MFAFFPIDHLFFGFFVVAPDQPASRLDFQHSVYHDALGQSWEACCYKGEYEKTSFDAEFGTYVRLSFLDFRENVFLTYLRPLPPSRAFQTRYIIDFAGRLNLFVFVRDHQISRAP